MYYQFTGQPGHGKTVLALAFALDMKAKADRLHEEDPAKHPLRELYVCNVRDFNAGKAGAIELPPAQVKEWHLLPEFDNAIILVDEAYEHGMFPKRAPGMKMPDHVQQVAKHRHRGIDFVMICQSPTRQMDDFLHDLIEEHYHVRRRYGLPLVNLKRWDRFERRPDKAQALTVTRKRYPVHVFKLYTSTKYDTSEKRVPWFYWAILATLLVVLALVLYVRQRMAERFGDPKEKAAQVVQTTGMASDGASATALAMPGVFGGNMAHLSLEEYESAQQPRNVLKPWSAPIFDDRQVKAEPAVFCASSGQGLDGQGKMALPSCSCVTEQGTPYRLSTEHCMYVARWGQPYNPYRERSQEASAQSAGQGGGVDQAATVGAVVGHQEGSRGDVFPRNPARTVSSWTPPTSTL
jgi:hypothetical protein